MRLIMLFMIIVLCSCSNNITPIAYHCPAIQLAEIPKLPIETLSKKSKPDEVVKAYVSTLVILKGWIKITKDQVDVYNTSN